MKNILVLLLLFPTVLMAQTVRVEEAENRARQFMQTQPQTRASQQEVQLSLAYTSKAGDETYYYVFNNSAGGYIIMGGDEAAHNVLGYSDMGTFDYDRIPDNMRWWLSQYDAELSYSIGEVKAGRTRVAKAQDTHASWQNIPAMLTTKWGQDEPYNSQIPTYAAGYTGENALVTGCVATAAAQVMKYHEWPDTGVGSAIMGIKYAGLPFEADFGQTHYDWAHMTDTYTPGTYTGSKEEIAVGTLMYHLGVATDSKYGQGSTTAFTKNLISSLTYNFKYNKGIAYARRQYYSDMEWEQLIYNELAEGRPVIYGGYAYSDNKKTGHQFVCDGYEDGRWHINWGWNGDYNTTFLLTASATEEALRPTGTGTGGAAANADYSIDQDAIIGMCPDKDGTSEYKRASLIITKIYVDNYFHYQPGETATADVYVDKQDKDGYYTRFKCKLVNTEDDEEVYIIPDIQTVLLPPGESCNFKVSFTIPAEAKNRAQYRLVLMMEDEQGEWNAIESKKDASFTDLKVSEWTGIGPDDSDAFALYNDGYFSVDGPIGTLYIKNYSQETLTQPLCVWVYPEEGGDSIDCFDFGEVTVNGKKMDWIDFYFKDLHSQKLPGQPQTMVPGQNYLIRLQNMATGEIMEEKIPFYFRESQTIEYTMPETGWGTFCLPFQSEELPEDLTVYYLYQIKNDELSLMDYSFLYYNLPFIVHGTPGTTYRFSGPVTPVGLHTEKQLKVSTECDIYAPKGSYVLQCRNGITGFYKVLEYNQVLVKRYEAYLIPDTECGDFIGLGEYYEPPTAIENIDTYTDNRNAPTYNLMGIEVGDGYRGIVISKGKKYIRK